MPHHNVSVGTGEPGEEEGAPFRGYYITLLQDDTSSNEYLMLVFDGLCMSCTVTSAQHFSFQQKVY